MPATNAVKTTIATLSEPVRDWVWTKATHRLTAALTANGFRVVAHTGGGNQPTNVIYDVVTKEVLAETEDTIEAHDAAFQPHWFHVDSVSDIVTAALPRWLR